MRIGFSLVLLLMVGSDAPAGASPLPRQGVGRGHTARIYRGVFTPDSKLFLTAGIDKTVRAWHVADGKPAFTLEGHAAPIHAIGHAGAKLLVTGGEDGAVFLWDLAQRKKIGELPKHKQPIQCLAVSKDGKLLATGGGAWKGTGPGELRLWDLEKRQELALLAGHKRLVLGASFAPDGKTLAAVDHSGELKIWDVATRKPVNLQLDFPPASVQHAPDGKQIAIGQYNGKLRTFDTETFSEESVIAAHTGGVLFLAFAPHGHMLASAGWDGGVRLWQPGELEDRPSILVGNHKGQAWGVAISPDGKTLASVGEDRLVNFWSITQELAKRFEPTAKTPAPAPKAIERKEAARVAILAAHDVDASRTAQDLTLAKLSDDKALHLLERTAIERILREQKLSYSGLVDATTAVKAGKLLAVDLLAVIEYSPQAKKNTGVIVFDAATGVKLLDAGLSAVDPALQAQQLAVSVRSAAEKWRAGTKSLKTVCFMPVRNADLPRSMDRYCEMLAASLERELLGGGSVALLERQRLALVNKEKTLAEEAATRELLTSLTVVEMDVSRGKDGKGLRVRIAMRNNAGKELSTVAHEVADPNGAGLLTAIAEKLRMALKATVADAAVSRGRESRRFHQEAMLLWKHKHYLQGLQAAEAAYALKQNDETRNLLTEYLICYATELIDPGGMRTLRFGRIVDYNVSPATMREALDLARRGLQLIDSARSALPDRNDETAIRMRIETFFVNDAQRFFFNKLPYLKVVPAQAEAQEEYAEFRRFCVERIVQRCFDVLEPGDDSKGVDRYPVAVLKNIESIERIVPTPQANAATLHRLAMRWLEHTKNVNRDGVSVSAASKFSGILSKLYHPLLISNQEKYDLPLGALELAKKHAHPLVRQHASHYHLRAVARQGKIAKDDAFAEHRKLIEEAKALIEKPPVEPHAEFRLALYDLMDHAIFGSYVYGLKGAPIQAQYLELGEFMLANGDLVSNIVQQAARYNTGNREVNLRSLKLIDAALKLIDSPRRRHWGSTLEQLRHEMKSARLDLLKTMPDLIKTELPWESARQIANAGSLNAHRIITAKAHEKNIYFFTGGIDAKAKHWELCFYQCAPPEYAPKLLSRTPVAQGQPVDERKRYVFWGQPETFVTSMALTTEHVYAGTVSEGILIFPLAGGPPVRIGEKEGLPTSYVNRIAIVGNTLIAGLDGGYLVSVDLKTRRVETLASSRRSEKRTPLDNGPPFTLWALTGDPERQRALFAIRGDSLNHPLAGLWEYDLKKQKITRIQPLIYGAWSPVHEGRIYLHWSEGLLAYDLARNEFTHLQGKPATHLGKMRQGKPPADFSMAFDFGSTLGRSLWHRGYIWEGHPFRRRTPDDKDAAPLPSPRDGPVAFNFSASVLLQAIDTNEIVVGGSEAIYMLRLKAK